MFAYHWYTAKHWQEHCIVISVSRHKEILKHIGGIAYCVSVNSLNIIWSIKCIRSYQETHDSWSFSHSTAIWKEKTSQDMSLLCEGNVATFPINQSLIFESNQGLTAWWFNPSVLMLKYVYLNCQTVSPPSHFVIFLDAWWEIISLLTPFSMPVDI